MTQLSTLDRAFYVRAQYGAFVRLGDCLYRVQPGRLRLVNSPLPFERKAAPLRRAGDLHFDGREYVRHTWRTE